MLVERPLKVTGGLVPDLKVTEQVLEGGFIGNDGALSPAVHGAHQ